VERQTGQAPKEKLYDVRPRVCEIVFVQSDTNLGLFPLRFALSPVTASASWKWAILRGVSRSRLNEAEPPPQRWVFGTKARADMCSGALVIVVGVSIASERLIVISGWLVLVVCWTRRFGDL
jgi:hypothetical protein